MARFAEVLSEFALLRTLARFFERSFERLISCAQLAGNCFLSPNALPLFPAIAFLVNAKQCSRHICGHGGQEGNHDQRSLWKG